MTTTAEKIKVMQAFEDGQTIQGRIRGDSHNRYEWSDNKNPVWDWRMYEYRIKPPELLYRHGDPVYVDGVEYGLYMRPAGTDGDHLISVESQTLVRTLEEFRPAPYRIRLWRDDDTSESAHLIVRNEGPIPGRNITVSLEGRSAELELIDAS